jgi:hypothetical protein
VTLGRIQRRLWNLVIESLEWRIGEMIQSSSELTNQPVLMQLDESVTEQNKVLS